MEVDREMLPLDEALSCIFPTRVGVDREVASAEGS